MEEEPGDGFEYDFGPTASPLLVGVPPGDLRSRVVFDRPISAALVGLEGVRWDVERSRAGVAVVGGVGAGR